MIPLALTALLLCAKSIETRLNLIGKAYLNAEGKSIMRASVNVPAEREKVALAARELLDEHQITIPNHPTSSQVSDAFSQLRSEELPPIDRDLRVIKMAMAAAPLWGLLGTVSGMLTTFDGLARGGGGEKTMNLVAGGISEALITTQTGLMIALPGYFFFYYLCQHRQWYDAFIAHLEAGLTQHLFADNMLIADPRSTENLVASPVLFYSL